MTHCQAMMAILEMLYQFWNSLMILYDNIYSIFWMKSIVFKISQIPGLLWSFSVGV